MSLNIVEVFLASLLKACEGGGMAIVAPSLALANSQSASIACHLYNMLWLLPHLVLLPMVGDRSVVCRRNYMPKMMLPATQTSCLKDSHTNFHVNVEIGITYF
jgi:hypothetical protein